MPEAWNPLATCLYCGREFKRTNKRHKYCSGRCKELYRVSKLELHEGFCKGCGAPIQYRINGGKPTRQYCSFSCQLKHTVPTKKLVCIDCGAEFDFVGRTKRLRCDACLRKHRNAEASARTKLRQAELIAKEGEASAGYYKYRKRVITGDDSCSICGYNKYQESLVVHHLDGNHYNSDPENLVITCANCHIRIHKLQRNRKKAFGDVDMSALYHELQEAELKERNEAGKPDRATRTEGCEESQSGATHSDTSSTDMNHQEAAPKDEQIEFDF